jgi:hypothetical protein
MAQIVADRLCLPLVPTQRAVCPGARRIHLRSWTLLPTVYFYWTVSSFAVRQCLHHALAGQLLHCRLRSVTVREVQEDVFFDAVLLNLANRPDVYDIEVAPAGHWRASRGEPWRSVLDAPVARVTAQAEAWGRGRGSGCDQQPTGSGSACEGLWRGTDGGAVKREASTSPRAHGEMLPLTGAAQVIDLCDSEDSGPAAAGAAASAPAGSGAASDVCGTVAGSAGANSGEAAGTALKRCKMSQSAAAADRTASPAGLQGRRAVAGDGAMGGTPRPFGESYHTTS